MSRFTADADALRRAAAALGREEDGVRLRRALAAELRSAVEPAVNEARGAILSMGAAGVPEEGEPLRAAIAGNVKAATRLSGNRAGVRVRATKNGMPRGFRNAPKRTNASKGWRHPVPPPRLAKGVEGPRRAPVWVHQLGKPGWFDDTLRARASQYRRAVRVVIDGTAARIARGAR